MKKMQLCALPDEMQAKVLEYLFDTTSKEWSLFQKQLVESIVYTREGMEMSSMFAVLVKGRLLFRYFCHQFLLTCIQQPTGVALAVLEWFISKYEFDLDDQVKWVSVLCERNKLELAQFLLTKWHIPKEEMTWDRNHVLRWICGSGYKEMVQWFVIQFETDEEQVVSEEKSAVHGGKYSAPPLDNACASGHWDLLQWLVKKFAITKEKYPKLGPRLLRAAFPRGCKEVITWLLQEYQMDPVLISRSRCTCSTTQCTCSKS